MSFCNCRLSPLDERKTGAGHEVLKATVQDMGEDPAGFQNAAPAADRRRLMIASVRA
jgi:hypothetical protein